MPADPEPKVANFFGWKKIKGAAPYISYSILPPANWTVQWSPCAWCPFVLRYTYVDRSTSLCTKNGGRCKRTNVLALWVAARTKQTTGTLMLVCKITDCKWFKEVQFKLKVVTRAPLHGSILAGESADTRIKWQCDHSHCDPIQMKTYCMSHPTLWVPRVSSSFLTKGPDFLKKWMPGEEISTPLSPTHSPRWIAIRALLCVASLFLRLPAWKCISPLIQQGNRPKHLGIREV